MSTALKTFLSMSCSGGLLILILLLGKRLLKDKISRQWQYYIWMIVILRLLLPFGPEASLLGEAYQSVDQAVTQAIRPPQPPMPDAMESIPAPIAGSGQDDAVTRLAGNSPATHPLPDGWLLINLIWLAVALGLLIRKITIYQGFIRYLHAGMTPVSDVELLDRLSITTERAGVQRPIDLCVHPLISSPLLIGFFHPCIVLPSADIPEKDFHYIVLHELTHYKRRDMLYKWLVQVTVCLHWFNPLVHLMEREITKACEFSCDEAVLIEAGSDQARDYGSTLLEAMAAVGRYKEHPGAVPLSGNKLLLKERLDAIMNFRKKSSAIRILTGVLTLCVILGAAFAGVYPVAAESRRPSGRIPASAPEETGAGSEEYASQAERYYEAGSLPLFEMAFPKLDEKAQREWLERLYAGGDFAFFSVAVRGLDGESPLLTEFAEKAYADEETAFFSTLTDCMDRAELNLWLDRALEDGNWAFQSMLFNKLDRDSESDELEENRKKELEEVQAAEYQSAGITMDGGNYYYQGQLVNVFLDIRANKSFYTLNMNPSGAVNIRVTRDGDNKIAGVAYLTEAEAAELLEDMDDDWQEPAGGRIWYPRMIPVHYEAMAAGEAIWLGEYTLSEGDRIWYDVSAETGNGLQVGFAKPGDSHLNTAYYSVKSLRQQDQSLECIASFTVGPPVQAGTYQLFLRATDGALGNVKGSISIGFAAEAE